MSLKYSIRWYHVSALITAWLFSPQSRAELPEMMYDSLRDSPSNSVPGLTSYDSPSCSCIQTLLSFPSILEQASHAPTIHIVALGLPSALKVLSKMLHDLFSHLLKVLSSKWHFPNYLLKIALIQVFLFLLYFSWSHSSQLSYYVLNYLLFSFHPLFPKQKH